jgi:hypothetical protein
MSHVLCPIVFMMLECDRDGVNGEASGVVGTGGMFSYFTT